MTLAPGTRLGAYEIAGLIGAGGMGEVYRARDSRLNRDVAIKVLPASVASDRERLLRFEREARTLASLNHPNIAQVYGSLEEPPALVMELVDGEDLSARLTRGPLPVDDALGIAAQIAAALEDAHERGIIHRDLKPGNVMVRGDGTIKVLDFGLAKAIEPQAGSADLLNSPTVTSPATQMGIILGTAAYMAPEQAKGRAVDRRADIWAFGVVLYEMLTGRQPFSAGTVTETLAAVLRADVDLDALPPDVPTRVRWLLSRCLERDPRNRLRDIGEARVALADPGTAHDQLAPARRRPEWISATLAAMAGLTVASLGWCAATRRPSESAPPVRFTVAAPAGTRYVMSSPPALSSDGTHMVFGAAQTAGQSSQLYLRTLDRPEPTPVAGSDAGAQPFFAPDAQWIGFFTDRDLRKVPLTGGAAVSIADAPEARGGAWRGDGSIIFAPRASGGLYTVPSEGGVAEPFTTPDQSRQEVSHRYPHALPDGRILFSILTADPLAPAIGIVDRRGGAHRVLVQQAFSPHYLTSGHLVFAKALPTIASPPDAPLGAGLVAVPFRDGRIAGEPVPVMGNVAAVQPFAVAHFAAAANGTLATLTASPSPRRLAWVAPDGTEQSFALPRRAYADARVSPDGKFVAMVSTDGDGDLWVLDVQRQLLERAAQSVKRPTGPVWSADGRSLIVAGLYDGRPAILHVGLDRASVPRPLTSRPLLARPADWRDRTLLLEEMSMTTRIDLSTLQLGRDDVPRALLRTPAVEAAGRLSPDGAVLAYRSDGDVYVRPFRGSVPSIRVSRGGGINPVWSRDGQTLFFQADRSVLAATIRRGEPAGEPREVIKDTRGQLQGLSPDGRRFLFLLPDGDTAPVVTITLGWLPPLLRGSGRH